MKTEESHPNLRINQEVIEAVNTGEDYPETLTVDGEDAFTLTYHSTDAWRGYYEPVPIEGSGWEALEDEGDGWVTGDYDDAPIGARSSTIQRIATEAAELGDSEGYDVVIVFTPTSNVFSTSYDLFRRTREDAEPFDDVVEADPDSLHERDR